MGLNFSHTQTETLNIQKANRIDDIIGMLYNTDLSSIGIDNLHLEDLFIMLKMIRDRLWEIG